MDSKRLRICQDKLNQIKDDFKNYKKDPDLEKIELIVKKCNIFEDINIKYLQELKKIESPKFDEKFKELKSSISAKKIKEIFSEEKLSAIETIQSYLKRLNEFCKIQENSEKELLFQSTHIFMSTLKEDSEVLIKPNFQLLPSDNLELYMNILYRIICAKLYMRLLIYSDYNIITIKNQEDKNNLELIKNTESYIPYKAFINPQFKNYFNYLGIFLEGVKNNYKIRFSNCTFKDEKDISLFIQFLFFIANYEFENFDNDYIDIWNESLNETLIDSRDMKKEIELVNLINGNNMKIELKGDNIEVKIQNKYFIIKDVEKYSFKSLIKYLSNLKISSEVDELDIIRYLKVQYFNDYIKHQIIGEKWKNFYDNVFQSNIIDDLLYKLYKYKIDKSEYKNIIDSIIFFNFDCSFYGETSSLGIFISGTMDIKNDLKYYKKSEKMKYYIKMLLTILHEILGHEYTVIRRYIFGGYIQSPITKGKNFTNYANIRGREAGEFALVTLFGKRFDILSIEEVCYIFNINNYSKKDVPDFIKGFISSKDEQLLNVPEIIEDIIDINDKNLKIFIISDYSSKNEEFLINLIDEKPKLCGSAILSDIFSGFYPFNYINKK